jgi:penicillin-binding protein 1B
MTENNNRNPNRRTRRTNRAKTSATKASPSSSPTKAKRAKRSMGKRSWLLAFWSFSWKASIALFAILVFVGVYLNSQVKQRFDGQLFELPTVVYARILTLAPGDLIGVKALRQELDALNYRKVSNPSYAGEYSASSTKVELIRRPFEFSDGPEPDRHVMLHFNGNEITRIQSLETDNDLGYLRLEPKMLGMLEKNSTEQRLFLRRVDFPEVMIDALIATEDRQFYQHDGIAPLAIARALVANIKAGRTVQGGSTLTQQLAKNLFLSRDRTIWRKLQEAYMALIIDYRYSKDRILEGYLNEVYLGQNGSEAIHGFGLASRLYFGLPLQELRLDQLALLVGMVKGPSYYNPQKNPERALERRDLVLKLMQEQEILSAQQYAEAVAHPLDIQSNPHIANRKPAYFQQLSIELKEKVGDAFKSDMGLKVFTTLDPVSQQELERAVANRVPKLAVKHANELEAAAIAVDRQSGEIRAMVGGKNTSYDGYNRVLNASRQIGSLAKPAVYLTALQHPESYNLATSLVDKPFSLKLDDGQVWSPKNYEKEYLDAVPLYLALARSINIPTIRLGMALGIDKVTETLVNLGVDLDEIRPVPSMFLGAFSLTPFHVAQMFQTLTNSGNKSILSALRTVVDSDGNVLYQSMPKSVASVNEQAAWLTTYAMKQGVIKGTGRYLSANFGWASLAGKTGTTNDTHDSWFVGVDGREVTTIWVGRDDNNPTGLTGASGALRVYAEYLQQRPPQVLNIPLPDGITMFGFKESSDGTLELDCKNQYQVPIWDKAGTMSQECKKQADPLNWLKNIFEW